MLQAFLFLVDMIYKQVPPNQELAHLIKSFWLIDSEGDKSIRREKIIPDGYPELIFHFGDSYRININGEWKLQEKSLLAGQIRNFFFLENTGESKMFAIKFQPWAVRVLFGIDMSALTDNVIKVSKEIEKKISVIRKIAIGSMEFLVKVKAIEEEFQDFMHSNQVTVDSKYKIVQTLVETDASIPLKALQEKHGISERSLERYFKTNIGLAPKYYSRIIRFSSIFKLVQDKSVDWADIVHRAGYYDQSHFIKNFKEFTGEDPSKYGFSEKNMANFFLKP